MDLLIITFKIWRFLRRSRKFFGKDNVKIIFATRVSKDLEWSCWEREDRK